MAKLIFGCGYLGRRVARKWRDTGEQVHVVTRSDERAVSLRAEGLIPHVADVTEPRTLAGLPHAETVLFAIGMDRSSGKSIEEVYVHGLVNVLEALPGDVQRFIYISSTGVYGSNAGEWVDENSPCDPQRAGGKACLTAEQLLLAHRLGTHAIILRMAGIYGPGRIPLAEKLKAGEPIPAPADGYLNLIHVDDAAEIVLRAEAKATPPRRYCVADGQPAQRWEYYTELARLLDAPPPNFIEPAPGTPAAQRAAADKRIRNQRMLAELGVQLAYPSYREGLAAITADE